MIIFALGFVVMAAWQAIGLVICAAGIWQGLHGRDPVAYLRDVIAAIFHVIRHPEGTDR